MKKLLVCLLVLGSFSVFANNCGSKAIEAVKTKVMSGATGCDISTAGDYKVEQVITPSQIQATIIEISYYCEAGAGAVVVFNDDCSNEGSVTLTDNWE